VSDHHFFVEPDDIASGVLTLRGEEAHHAGRVLRVRIGEPITAADGTGRVVSAVVTSAGETVEAEVTAEQIRTLPRPAITLFQAVAKGDKLEAVVEKATEVGVHRIVPFVAERTVAQWDERKLERVHERLRAIAKAAAKQCKAPVVPDIEAVASGLDGAAGPGTVVLHESATERLRDVLPETAPDVLCLVVGPEGGLSETEVDGLVSSGSRVATLGSRILRTETAGPIATAVIGFRYGWFG
jgi:16S rRNA (uracil1498-N3)-methyltransferase